MKYDVVVIGAGPGGIFSAYELIRLNPDLKIAGIVLVAYPVTTNLGAEIQQELAVIAEKIGTKVFQPPIRRTIRVQQAHAHRTPVIYYDRSCTAAQDYIALVDNLLGGE